MKNKVVFGFYNSFQIHRDSHWFENRRIGSCTLCHMLLKNYTQSFSLSLSLSLYIYLSFLSFSLYFLSSFFLFLFLSFSLSLSKELRSSVYYFSPPTSFQPLAEKSGHQRWRSRCLRLSRTRVCEAIFTVILQLLQQLAQSIF